MEAGYVRVKIETSSIPNLKIISIDGNFDTVTSRQVDEKIMPIIEKEKSNFILNLNNLIQLSSAGLLRLLSYLTSMTDQKRLLKLIKPPEHIYDLFVIVGIASRFEMYDNLEAALGSF
jgi:anti-anti-sigma factor